MKKIFCILMAIMMMLSLFSCSSKQSSEVKSEVISTDNTGSVQSEVKKPVYETSNGLQVDQLGISDDFKYKDSSIKNIALFGVDFSTNDMSRSDAIMIVSIDTKKKTAKISSVLRDSYVPIELPDGDTIHTKINAAYFYGSSYKSDGYKTSGPQLAIHTLNRNFDLNIKDYIAVNFKEAANVIDYLGGVDIEITESERRNMNAMDYNKLIDTDNKVEESGMVHLNGIQTVQYARVREIDSDVMRTQRQRKVLSKLLDKIKALDASQYSEFIKKMLSIVKTSLDFETVLFYADLIDSKTTFTANTFPVTDEDNKYYQYTYGGLYYGQWVWLYDTDLTAAYMHNFIYGEDITDVDTSWRY